MLNLIGQMVSARVRSLAGLDAVAAALAVLQAEVASLAEQCRGVAARLAAPRAGRVAVAVLYAEEPQGDAAQVELELGTMVASPRMIVRSRILQNGATARFEFEIYRPIPKGAWVVVWGPAVATCVMVGPEVQSVAPIEGPVCVLADAVPVGGRVLVDVRGQED